MNTEHKRQSESVNHLAAKLARIMGEVGKVEKNGRNEHFRYDYVTENDLVYAVRSKLAEAGVMVLESTVSQKVGQFKNAKDEPFFLTEVETEHTFVDGESGEWFTVKSQGQGSDNGDKGGYKAITGAMKYFIYKNFMIPTGDDPEADTKTDERGSARREQTQTEQKPAQSSGGASRTQAKTEVPRDSKVTDDMRKQFTGNLWQRVKIHFGKQDGKRLGELDAKSLEWWINDWQPKEYPAGTGKISEENLLLRAALDVANDEWK